MARRTSSGSIVKERAALLSHSIPAGCRQVRAQPTLKQGRPSVERHSWAAHDTKEGALGGEALGRTHSLPRSSEASSEQPRKSAISAWLALGLCGKLGAVHYLQNAAGCFLSVLL